MQATMTMTMSDDKQEGDLRESEAVEFTEGGKPVFERSITENADTDNADGDGLHQAIETEDDR